MRPLLPLTLLGFSAVLVAMIVYEITAPFEPVVIETPRPAVRQVPSAGPLRYEPPAEQTFADLDARPLFSSDRKPLPDLGHAGTSSTATSDLSLAGTIMDGQRAIALFRSKSSSTSVSAGLGDMVNGWRVIRIEATAVTLRGNGGEFVVPLESPGSRSPSAALQPLAPLPASAAAAAPLPTAPPAPGARAAATAPAALAAVPAAAPATAQPPPLRKTGGTISPEALKGAPINPATGEPTL